MICENDWRTTTVFSKEGYFDGGTLCEERSIVRVTGEYADPSKHSYARKLRDVSVQDGDVVTIPLYPASDPTVDVKLHNWSPRLAIPATNGNR